MLKKMLKEAGNGGIILLATDGQNTKGLTDICHVEREIIDAGIRVITIAIGYTGYNLNLTSM